MRRVRLSRELLERHGMYPDTEFVTDSFLHSKEYRVGKKKALSSYVREQPVMRLSLNRPWRECLTGSGYECRELKRIGRMGTDMGTKPLYQCPVCHSIYEEL